MRRVTKCFTYGEERREHVWLYDSAGQRSGSLTLAVYITACGRESEGHDLKEVPDVHVYKRPVGICQKCWANWQKSIQESYGVHDEA